MIIVSGMNRKTGEVRTQSYQPGQEGSARTYREYLRSLGYQTAFVNDVARKYHNAVKPWKCRCDGCIAQRRRDGLGLPEPLVNCASKYVMHSLGTGTGQSKGKHIPESEMDFLGDAIENAEKLVGKWRDTHKGIVIYKAIKLVRKVTKPTTEIVELS